MRATGTLTPDQCKPSAIPHSSGRFGSMTTRPPISCRWRFGKMRWLPPIGPLGDGLTRMYFGNATICLIAITGPLSEEVLLSVFCGDWPSSSSERQQSDPISIRSYYGNAFTGILHAATSECQMVTAATTTDHQKFTGGILRAIEVTWNGGTPEEATEAPLHAGLQPQFQLCQ